MTKEMPIEEAIKWQQTFRETYMIMPEEVEACDMAIKALEKQLPKKPYSDNENGVYEKEYCPTCHRSLFPNEHHCKCGQTIDWSE